MSEPHSRILIVEDEATIRRFVRLALESAGHEIHEAEGVRRGLIEAGTRRPDLIVLDLGLPDGDGIDLIRDLRQWSSMPVIVLSARSREADKIAAPPLTSRSWSKLNICKKNSRSVLPRYPPKVPSVSGASWGVRSVCLLALMR